MEARLFSCTVIEEKINADKMLTVAPKRYSEQQINRSCLDLESTLSLTITLPFNNIIVSVDTAKTWQPRVGGYL